MSLAHGGKALDMPVLHDATPASTCHTIVRGTVVLSGLYVAKNFAEILFQTLEPILRGLVHAQLATVTPPALHTSQFMLYLPGSQDDYRDAVYALPLRMLSVFGPVHFMDELTTEGPACMREVYVVSPDPRYIYRYTAPKYDMSTFFYSDNTPPLFADVWRALAVLFKSHFMSLPPLPPHDARTRLANVTIIDRPTTRVTTYGTQRDFARAIMNLDDVITRLSNAFPILNVRHVMMEDYSLAEQLEIIHHTHILIAVHGAGCIHAVFLPHNAIFIHVAPFMIRHELFPKVCLASGHHCMEYRQPSIAQSIMYSHTLLPDTCAAAIRRHHDWDEVHPVYDTRMVMHRATASGLTGIDGGIFRAFDDVILSHERECQLNAYYWKQQDVFIDLDEMQRVVASALTRLR